MTTSFISTVLFLLAWGVSVTGSPHEHGAHVHGDSKLSVAFDGKSGTAEFSVPGESLNGFENKPKNKQQEKKVAEGLSQIEREISKMLVFAPELKCVFRKTKIEINYGGRSGSGTHSDVDADFEINCEKSPAGSRVVLNFFQPWLKMKSVESQFLVNSVQKSFQHQKNGQGVDLK